MTNPFENRLSDPNWDKKMASQVEALYKVRQQRKWASLTVLPLLVLGMWIGFAPAENGGIPESFVVAQVNNTYNQANIPSDYIADWIY